MLLTFWDGIRCIIPVGVTNLLQTGSQFPPALPAWVPRATVPLVSNHSQDLLQTHTEKINKQTNKTGSQQMKQISEKGQSGIKSLDRLTGTTKSLKSCNFNSNLLICLGLGWGGGDAWKDFD